MRQESITTVFYSPTGTTERVLRAIAEGTGLEVRRSMNITTPGARAQEMETTDRELLLIGVPVYMGRVPGLLEEWLASMRLDDTPTVCVVVYGNRAFENALLELKDIVMRQGGIPIAGGAYVGEHSFSDPGTPTAEGRPDAEDTEHAVRFGRMVRNKLAALDALTTEDVVNVPGSFPYEGITTLWDVDFIEVSEDCTQCGLCAEVCPTGAVDAEDSSKIDTHLCITCCACIKHCPNNARSMKPGPVMDARNRLYSLYRDRKEPEVFL